MNNASNASITVVSNEVLSSKPRALCIITPEEAAMQIKARYTGIGYNKREALRNAKRHQERPAQFHLKVFSMLVLEDSDELPTCPEFTSVRTFNHKDMEFVYSVNLATGRLMAFAPEETDKVGLPTPLFDIYTRITTNVYECVEETLKVLLD